MLKRARYATWLALIFGGGKTKRKRILLSICLMAVLIPTAVGATIIVSNRLCGSFNVVSVMKITWVTGNPDSQTYVPGTGEAMQIKVENPSTVTYDNCVLDFSIRAPGPLYSGPGFGTEVMYQLPSAGHGWIELPMDNAQASNYYYTWHMELPAMSPGAVYLANFSMFFWSQPPMPIGSYSYDLVVRQTTP
jgi:hypothetical protein